jgi:hypothetical protein
MKNIAFPQCEICGSLFDKCTKSIEGKTIMSGVTGERTVTWSIVLNDANISQVRYICKQCLLDAVSRALKELENSIINNNMPLK